MGGEEDAESTEHEAGADGAGEDGTAGGDVTPGAESGADGEVTGLDASGSDARDAGAVERADAATETTGATSVAEDGPEPGEFEGSPFESAASRQSGDPEAVGAELRALEDALARQAELIEEQRAAIEALAEELEVE
jgi:hypothetical protein